MMVSTQIDPCSPAFRFLSPSVPAKDVVLVQTERSAAYKADRLVGKDRFHDAPHSLWS